MRRMKRVGAITAVVFWPALAAAEPPWSSECGTPRLTSQRFRRALIRGDVILRGHFSSGTPPFSTTACRGASRWVRSMAVVISGAQDEMVETTIEAEGSVLCRSAGLTRHDFGDCTLSAPRTERLRVCGSGLMIASREIEGHEREGDCCTPIDISTRQCVPTSENPGNPGCLRRGPASAPFRFLLALGVVAAFDFSCSNSHAPINSTSPTANGPSSAPTSVAIAPPSATVQIGDIALFSAIVSPGGASQVVAWSVAGTGCSGASCGTIDAAGRYSAPASMPNPPTVTVTARSVVDSTMSAAATVTIIPVQSFSVNPGSVAFGNQTVNATSAPRAVTLTNTGGSPQWVDGRMAGAPGQWQDFTSTNDCPSMLAVRASCTFNITFTPSATGARVAYLFFDGTFENESFVNLIGTGTK